ncbi:MAG: DsbA family protein [Chthoniobacterales bacterium]
MKRLLPFIIIAFVGVATVGIATAVYRIKTRPTPTPAAGASVTPTAAKDEEDSALHTRGPRDAPVTIEFYGDFQCPSCAVAAAAMDELDKLYPGKLRLVFHEFPLEMHNHAVEAAKAAEAAGLQGHFWQMHDMLYQYQPVWSRVSTVGSFFDAYANSLGLNVDQFRADLQSPEVEARVMSDSTAGVVRGVKNTPTIFINGQEVKTAFTLDKLREVIDQALAAKKKS